MWEEYAAQIGKSVKDLTDAEKRQAEYNGIMQETRFQVGDAAKLTQTFSGELSAFTAETKMAKAAVGDALEPTLAKLTGTARDVVSTFREWAEDNPKTVAGLVTFGAAASGGLMTLSAIGLMLPSIIKGFQLVTSNVKLATAAQWLWNAALNANPIGIVIGLVSALAGTLVYLYKTNDTARYQMLQAWGSIKVGVMSVIDTILRKLQELTSFIPGINEKIQQYRDSLSKIIDDEKAVQSMRRAEKAMSDYADARQREIERNNEAAGSYAAVTNKIDENTVALGGAGGKGSGGNTKAIKDNTEAMSYAEQQLIRFRAAYIAASGASSNLTAEHKYLNDSLYVVQQRINSLREQIQLKSAEENVDAEVIKALLEEYDNWISKEKDLQDQLKKTNEQLKKQIDQKITLADLGGGKSKKEVAELASVIYLQNQMEKKGTITSEDLNKLPKFHSGKAAGSTSKEIPAIIRDDEWVIPDHDVKRVPALGMGGINFVLQFNQPIYGLADLERQIRNILERMDVASILYRQLARAGVRV